MTWPTPPIGSLCENAVQRDPRQCPDEFFRYIDISSIDRNRKTITEAASIIGSDAPSRARKEVRYADVLVSTVRPNLNTIAQIDDTALDGEIASTGFCVLRPRSVLLVSRYLFYYCQTPLFIEEVTKSVRGAHYPAVSDTDVKSVRIPLPLPSE